ncbi:adenine deaminase [Parageobacillus genomosp. 1]|uniref:Adenine deaminase n=1 Tax=Parageobacillus genomosp. 1 TaxID=1295642 RepID=A0ABC9VJ01_9BACL|nr:adenine deaminase C-terminal domain-containing protein [Parageobacillus genomosp. 1]EZP78718.1 adenine deaminase [Parageobacillus genomosp. 1]
MFTHEIVYGQLERLHQSLKDIGSPTSFNPFVTLSFLVWPVIPELKMTDRGLFDVKRFQHISVEAR